jgi:hypothetical protein
MAALACWWFFWFITLIGDSSGNAQELAGIALGKAVICGGVAGIWFYKARKANLALKPVINSVVAHQPLGTPEPESPQPPALIEQAQVVPAPESSQESKPTKTEEPPKPEDVNGSGMIPLAVGLGIAIAVFVALYIAISNQNPTYPLSSVAQTPPNQDSKNLFDAGLQSSPGGNPPCPSGLPAGVQIVPIDDLTTITASDGQLSHEDDGDKEAWHFSFKVLNQTAVSSPDRKFSGYCITGLALVVSLQAENGSTYEMPWKQSFSSPYSYLSPGWSQECKYLSLGSYHVPHDGDLLAWKITKAWGFPLNQSDPFAAYGGHEINATDPKSGK